MFKTIISFFLFAAIIYSQTHTIEGFVFDVETSEPLSYTNVRIDGTTSGTSTNINGRFSLKLKSGSYRLVFSFIGYKPDTLSVIIPANAKIKIGLEPQSVKLPEVVVSADEDPAYSIIREAIKRKKENRKGLTNFEYNAYSKRIILSADEVAIIEETFVKGYNKINEWEKEFILSTHKTENRKKEIYTMDFSIAEDYYIDFSADTLNLILNVVYLPLYENAFDYYDYKLLKIIEAEDDVIYLIKVIPRSKIQPLLEGEITIESGNYALNSVNLQSNKGVRFPYINDFKVKFVEQLGKYEGYWLPNYVEVKARLSVNLGGLITIEPMSFNQISSITEYNINKPIPDSVVNAVRSSYGYFTADTSVEGVKPAELSREEITYLRPIPLTGTEVEAYATLDSSRTIEKMIKVGGVLSAFIPDSDEENDTTTSFIVHTMKALSSYGYFRDNRVTGIVLGARYDGKFFTDRLNMNISAGYSLRREKIEGRLLFNYKFNDFFLDEVEGGVYQYSKMWQIFTLYPDILNSISVLIGFNDQFNYYLAKGYNLGIGKKFSGSFFTKLSFISEQQDSLPAHKYQSIFGSNRSVRENPNIIEGKDNRLSLLASLGKNPMELQPFLQSGLIIQLDFSNPAFSSDFNYRRFRAIGMVKTKTFYKELFVAPYLQFTIDVGLITGTYGPQHIFTPNTALAFYSPPGVFKGLKPYEFIGTEMIAVHLEHNWRTVPFQAIGLDFITDLHIDLITGISGLRMWNKSEYLREYSMDNTYWEAYLGISRIFAFSRLDFAYTSLNKFAIRAAIAVIF